MNDSVAIISDVHGNYPALKAVLKDIDARGIENVYCLGDIVGYYCMINEVMKEIREREIPCIMGNHDFALSLNDGIIERSKTCTKILQWQKNIITDENLQYLKSLQSSIEFSFGDKTFFCIHGGLNDYVDEYLFDVSNDYLKAHNFKADVLITGHTHLSIYKTFFSGISWLNPGSVGQPRDGNIFSSYLIIHDNGTLNYVRVKYDVEQIIEAMKLSLFDEYIYAPLLTGKKIGIE